jgi:epoxide hydrolase-like predicted phosphatase
MNKHTFIFDWGGVLIDAPSAGITGYCATILGIETEAFWQAYRQVEFEFYLGRLPEHELWQKICNNCGIELPLRCREGQPSLWYEAFSTAYQPREEMFELVDELKAAGCKVGLLSNTELPSLQFFDSPIYDAFDFSVFSCVEQVAKPDEAIYRLALSRAAALPQDCTFIDDKKENTDAAEKIGINAIHFKTIAQTKQKITEQVNSQL